ncbi:MAG: SPFH domain-containing protein [Anaerolineales bacterium]|jgi:regulator of protease activity HflC (stomatin/prohibitin superfamily)
MSQDTQLDATNGGKDNRFQFARGCLGWLYKNALVIIIILIVGGTLFSLARAAVYKIRPYERGLHLRGGRFIGIDEPGWHIQIPFVDTVIGVIVIERSGTIDQLAAMTADDVTMDVSLLYTYRVTDPVRYQLEVLDPERIVAGYVQGTLRDVVNTRMMDEVMHSRAEINREVINILQEKEEQYGVEFILIQIQSASPPGEVVNAIKNRMVAVELQEQASAEAAQQRTLADSQFYTAQKKAEGEAYQITRLAEAQAESLRIMLQELEGKGPLAEQYIQVLIAQELRQNSKWIISDGETMPVIDFGDSTLADQSTVTEP